MNLTRSEVAQCILDNRFPSDVDRQIFLGYMENIYVTIGAVQEYLYFVMVGDEERKLSPAETQALEALRSCGKKRNIGPFYLTCLGLIAAGKM